MDMVYSTLKAFMRLIISKLSSPSRFLYNLEDLKIIYSWKIRKIKQHQEKWTIYNYSH